MKKKYNLVLLPKLNEWLPTYAEMKELHALTDTYILGENSIPHVTLYQFEYEESNINSLWQHISSVWQHSLIKLSFDSVSFITFNHETYWASLIPDHQDELKIMHKTAARLLSLPIKENFDPHMTLFNTLDTDAKPIVRKFINPILPVSDTFSLALGHCDAVGQLTKVINLIPTL